MNQPSLKRKRKAANTFLKQIALDNTRATILAVINSSGHARSNDLGVGEFLLMFIATHLMGKGCSEIGWGHYWYDMNDEFVLLADMLQLEQCQ